MIDSLQVIRTDAEGLHRGLGVSGLGRRSEHTFTQDDIEVLPQVASQVAIAVDNALAWGQIAALKEVIAAFPSSRARLQWCQFVGSAPACWHRVLGSAVLVVARRFPYLVASQ
jgi:hypothetical protein